MPPAARRTAITTCPLDCWDACSIRVTLEEDRAIRLDGNPDHPMTGTFLCARTDRYLERVYDPDRIRRPLLRRRRGEPALAVSWDEALDTLADRLRRIAAGRGPEAVLYGQSAGSMALQKKISERFFSLYGGVTSLIGDFCLGAGKFALERTFGDYRPHDRDDLLNSRLILLWGRDPFIAGPHLLPVLKRAKAAGARIVSINPVVVDRGRLVDRHVQPAPGGDLSLALALARRLLDAGAHDGAFVAARAEGWERFAAFLATLDEARLAADAGLEAAAISELASDLMCGRPFSILLGTGVGHYGVGVEAVESIASLSAMAGMTGVPGGGVSFSVRHGRGLDKSWRTPRPQARRREVVVTDFHRHLPDLDPPIELAMFAGFNPVASLPDARAVATALRRIPFVVVADFHPTSTTELADLVLPVTSFLEEDGVVPSWGHAWIGIQRSVIPPVGEARTDLEIWQALAARLGFASEMAGSGLDWGKRALAPALDQAAIATLEERGFVRSPAHEPVPYAGGAFPTATGRFIFPMFQPPRGRPRPDAAHPFILLTPKSRHQHLSQEIRSRRRDCEEVALHPEALARIGVSPGEMVSIANAGGSIPARARADATLRPEVAVLPLSGRPEAGTGVNLLTTSQGLASDGVTPAYYDCFVAITPQARSTQTLFTWV